MLQGEFVSNSTTSSGLGVETRCGSVRVPSRNRRLGARRRGNYATSIRTSGGRWTDWSTGSSRAETQTSATFSKVLARSPSRTPHGSDGQPVVPRRGRSATGTYAGPGGEAAEQTGSGHSAGFSVVARWERPSGTSTTSPVGQPQNSMVGTRTCAASSTKTPPFMPFWFEARASPAFASGTFAHALRPTRDSGSGATNRRRRPTKLPTWKGGVGAVAEVTTSGDTGGGRRAPPLAARRRGTDSTPEALLLGGDLTWLELDDWQRLNSCRTGLQRLSMNSHWCTRPFVRGSPASAAVVGEVGNGCWTGMRPCGHVGVEPRHATRAAPRAGRRGDEAGGRGPDASPAALVPGGRG